MAILKQGILGGVKGKVGSVVGSSWKGIATLRSLPLSVTNPRTAAQVGNRTRFSEVVALATILLSAIIKPLNDRFASAMSGYNLFVQRSRDCFTSAGVFVPANLILSRGRLGATDVVSVIADEGNNFVNVLFRGELSNGYQSATDKAYSVVMASNGDVLGYSAGISSRNQNEVEVGLSRDLEEGESISCYISFLRADGTMCADSTYATVVVSAV